MPASICAACGTQYANSETTPLRCVICQDERRYVPAAGQAWTSMPELRRSHCNSFRRLEPGAIAIGTLPGFAQDQRAILLRTSQGNVLWDCTTLLDDVTIAILTALGGIAAIVVSSPHAYTTVVEWSHAFNSPPVYLHAADRQFIARHDSVIELWEGDALEVGQGLTLLRCGGPFHGAAMLHWAQGAGGRGSLLIGSTLAITPDGRVGFVRSAVNHIPLDAATVLRIADVVTPWPFDTIHGGVWDQSIMSRGADAFAQSVRRHTAALGQVEESY